MKFRPFSLMRSRSALSFTSSTSSNSFIFHSFRTLDALGPPQSRDNPFSFLLLRTLDQNTGEWPVSPCGKVASERFPLLFRVCNLKFRPAHFPLLCFRLSTIDCPPSTFNFQLSTFPSVYLGKPCGMCRFAGAALQPH